MRSLVVVTIVLGSSACSTVSNLNTQRMAANETRAIANLRTIFSAQTMYYSQYGKFAATLAELGPAASGVAGPSSSDLIPGTLAGGTSGGYKFALTGSAKAFTATAVPEAFGQTGSRTFFMDESMTIRENRSPEPPNAQSPEVH